MKRKKYLSILLSLTMVLGTFATVNAAPGKNIEELQRPNVSRPAMGKSISVDPKTENLKDTDEVRIIVELGDKPLIEYATEKGVKLDELDKKTAKEVKDKLVKKQQDVKNKIKANNIKVKYINDFVNVASGFSLTTTLGEAKKIEMLPEVQSVRVVNEYSRPEPEMTSSKDIVKAVETWNLGYNGEGMVVAVLDTGIDSSHKDMILTNPGNGELQKTEVEALIAENGFHGTYRTPKVPYGYNYMDLNQEILDLGPDASRHGMHVAGIIGANGDEKNGGIKGVAPEAQLLAMKVFGNNPAMPSTFGDVIVKAIDDSVALGADVINMSLGSTASFVMPDDLEQVAVRRAVENGVLNSISAGNSAQFGVGWDKPYTQNPDYGVVGSPGLATDSIQVASVENTKMTTSGLEYQYNGIKVLAGYMSSGPDPVKTFNGSVQYVDCKLGLIGTLLNGTEVNDFEGTNVAGKIALIRRGGYDTKVTGDFVNKISNAQKQGAIGVIVYNNANSGLISMKYPEGGTIPAVFIQMADGQKLVQLIALGNNFVEFNNEKTIVPNPNAGKMSDFTSWGTTPNLDFKPEITAPGGNIWSTDNNNSYQLMSGTSMAAPHVSGGSALVLQRVDELTNLTGRERVEMAKNLLMSTAKPLGDKGSYNNAYGLSNYNFTSPRRQGAGVMDLYAATTTPAIIVEKNTGLSKINLKEIGDKSTFTVTVKNIGETPVSYKVKGTVQTDLAIKGYNYIETQGVYTDGTLSEAGPNGFWSGEFPISFDKETVEVPAGQSVDLTVTVDLTNTVDWYYNVPLKYIFENGTYIEGFVRLEDESDNNPTLSIPYSGFYGEWDKAPIIDATNYDKKGSPFYGYTAMAYEVSPGNYNFLGYDASETGNPNENNIAFSPNGDGVMDATIPVLSFLRNARELDINILDKDGRKIRDLANEEFLRKNYYDSGKSSPYTIHDMWTWDGTANNKIVKDGQYYYEIKARVDYKGSDWQTIKFPVKVDTKAPVIGKISYDKSIKALTVAANDGDYPIYSYDVIDNGIVIAESLDGKFDLSEITFSNKATLRVSDFAGNITVKELASILKGDSNVAPEETQQPSEPASPTTPVIFTEPTGPAAGDTTIPAVMVTSPEFFGTYKTSQLTFTGTINDASSIEYFKINGQDVPFVFNKSTGNWDFTAPVTLEDGYRSVNIEAKDSAGNEIAFAHKVFIDTKAPVINMTEVPVEDTRNNSITLKAILTDNLPSMRVRVNGNMVTNIAPDWSYFNDLPSAKYELSYEVKLNEGVNKIIIEAEDDAGNIATKEFIVNRIKAKGEINK